MTSIQGTYEFMSDNVRKTRWSAKPYLHSPVDDLHSFCYTAQWAAAFNDGASGEKHDGMEIQEFREMIADERRALAVYSVQHSLRSPGTKAEYGPFFAQFLALLSPWWIKLATLVGDWDIEMDQASALEGKDKEERLRLNFLIFGYRGVREYFELVHEHRASLQMET